MENSAKKAKKLKRKGKKGEKRRNKVKIVQKRCKKGAKIH